ncbi:MAG: SDR family oxidoreductase [Acidimicrobiales bacterium]|jgi:3-oxoacyl-[acyl-carrier protein] reductase|nr:SDR family oxidoreductase [Acidimicrobiales bacterium]
MDLGLRDRVVLISGAYRGTGAGTARVFAAEGARVAVHGHEPGQADAVVAGIVAAGGAAVAVDGDLGTDAGAARAVAQAVAAFGPVEVLVNNYGAPVDSSWGTPADDWVKGWEVNLLTAVRLTQQVLPGMRERGWGRVVFIGTIGTELPGDRNPDYYGTKAALPLLVRSLAKELRGTGITVNVVSPGMIATDEITAMMRRRALDAGVEDTWEAIERWAAAHMLANLTGRVALPEDIGRVVAFVASDAAWHVNGADLKVDGGARDA